MMKHCLALSAACPVNFEFMNYTVITSQCKAPKYPPDSCCKAFKDFACPYADILNDLTSDCADNMFTYIGLNGSYPSGLFASECREGKDGLACPATPPSQSANTSESQIICGPSLLLMLTSIFLVLLLTLVLKAPNVDSSLMFL